MQNKIIVLSSALIFLAAIFLGGCGKKTQPVVPVPIVPPKSVTTPSAPGSASQTSPNSGKSDEFTNEANQIDADLKSIDDESFSETGLDDVDQ